MLRHGLYPVQAPPKDKTISDLKQGFLIPAGAKNLPHTKFGILKLLEVYLWWSHDSWRHRLAQNDFIKWAKDNELSRKNNHDKF